MDSHTSFVFFPVGYVRSPHKEKFGIPRQAGLVEEVRADLVLCGEAAVAEAVRGLEAFSHVWLSFVFHASIDRGWSPTVRPPRLGGNRRVGVFASRAPQRPNPIGLSVVRLLEIDTRDGVVLKLAGADLLDGTPVLDIKPYIPYSDSIPDARSGFAPRAPDPVLSVRFEPRARAACTRFEAAGLDGLGLQIERLLSLDPRPAYKREDDGREYGMRFYDLDVRWRVEDGVAVVTDLLPVGPD